MTLDARPRAESGAATETRRRARLRAPRRAHRPRRPRRLRRRRGLAAAAVAGLLLAIPAWSYIQALTYPGSATFGVRSVEWVRDHGGGGLVDTIENWLYTRTPPSTRGNPTEPLPVVRASGPSESQRQVARGLAPPALPALPDAKRVTGEGVWHSAGWAVGGVPALQTAWFRPDPGHTSVVAGVAWIHQPGLRLWLIAGTTEPVRGASWPEGARVPPAKRSRLLATFESGWKMRDAHGGWLADGRTAVPLRAGAASLVIHADGTADVGSWGAEVGMAPNVVAVRQNLQLVVDGGRPAPGLSSNAHGRWGSAHNQLQFTARSAIGVDRHGNLIFVAGTRLDLAMLAQAMVKAGVIRGMELDIHPAMVNFNVYGPSRRPVKLLPALRPPATRYLAPDQRDFFALTLG